MTSHGPPTIPKSEPPEPRRREIRRALLDFFDQKARDLPWRRTQDPYRIWVSEIMLQQTRVDTVRDYYARWMERFPDVDALAVADVDDVLRQWQGLGYYARAWNLHRAAGLVRERHGSRVPEDPEELRALPGVGDYTAGAIGSIAFGRAEPAVDGNVRRVFSRMFDLERPTSDRLRTLAGELVDARRPGDFNQALMELGATVCTPRNPDCGACPLATHCLALVRGTVRERPPPRSKRPVPHVHLLTGVAVLPGGRTLVRRRPVEGLLGGMWEFPAVEIQGAPAVPDVSTVPEPSAVSGESENTPTLTEPRRLEPVDHRFSHLRATYHPVLVWRVDVSTLAVCGYTIEVGPEPVRTPTFAELDSVPLPVAQRKIAALASMALASAAAAWRAP